MFSYGRLFDARTFGKLVFFIEMENLYGFLEDFVIFFVKDFLFDIVCIYILLGFFSEEFGVRALYDGYYIDFEFRYRRNGGVEVILYLNGRDD